MRKNVRLVACIIGLISCGSIPVAFAQNSIQNQQGTKTAIVDKALLDKILDKNRQSFNEGKVADYIPELGKANASSIALSVVNSDGTIVSIGDVQQRFTIQSISKIVSLMIAVLENGEQVVFNNMGYYGTDKTFQSFCEFGNIG